MPRRALAPFLDRAWLRPVRLWTGCTLFAYVLTHLLNHTLGNVSVAAMEQGLLVQKWIWQGWLGTAALYTAFLTHALLGLWALYERRYFRWTVSEMVQLTLGLCIPLMLANHLTVTRLALTSFGLDKAYAQELYALWVVWGFFGWLQVTTLIVAWTHGCMGMHFRLRLLRFYASWERPLLCFAVLLPVLALVGFAQGGRAVAHDLLDPQWRAVNLAPARTGTPGQVAWLAHARDLFLAIDAGLLLSVLAARGLRRWQERARGLIQITWLDGRVVRVPRGFSVLEASQIGRISHASVCGGRARCSTCRVRVLHTARALPAPSAVERDLLARVGVDSALVRLACQLRPRGDLAVAPIVPADVAGAFVVGRARRVPGEERFVVAMFTDMRGSMQLAERYLPFDSVFLLGRFIDAVSSGIVEAGGLPNQFLGDGVLALFGLNGDPRSACAQAIAACGLVGRNLSAFNAQLGPDTIGFGIGVHCGRAVVGEIGFGGHVTFTALGEPVHVAARLQAMTRQLGCDALISEEVMQVAGQPVPSLPAQEVSIRGREAALHVRLLGRSQLALLLR